MAVKGEFLGERLALLAIKPTASLPSGPLVSGDYVRTRAM